MTGEWPTEEVDHRDQVRTNNRWDNLRLATHGQNGTHKGPNKNNKLGIKGVRREHNRYVANLWKDGKSVAIGRFDTAEEASSAYFEAAESLHGEFAHG